jgi:hypothetical protein
VGCLHRPARAAGKHAGNYLLEALGLARPGPFEVQEGEAWRFTFEVRDRGKDDFQKLLSASAEWYGAHVFAGKDWEESPDKQYARHFGREMPPEVRHGLRR